ncbi:MAG: DMT family transporter [Lentisphaeria bacterium]|nr:DMT family transporter [Lentisphaeria bacterium]
MKPRADLLLAFVTMISAVGWLFSKKSLLAFEPFTFLFFRFFIAAVLLAALSWPKLKILRKEQIMRSVLTGTSLGIALLVWVVGLHKTNSMGEGAFILSLTVVMVPILGRLFFGDKASAVLIVSLVPAVTGLFYLSIDNGFQLQADQWYFLVATIGFALHLNLSNHYVKNIPSLANTTIQIFMVSFLALLAGCLNENWTGDYGWYWGWVIASAVIATTVRFALQNYTLQFLVPSHASMIFLLEPIWVAILGVIFLNEHFTVNKIIGCMLIFMALLVFRSSIIWGLIKRRNVYKVDNED